MDRLSFQSSEYMPPMGSPYYLLLNLLSDGAQHLKSELYEVLGDDPRSALQVLKGERYGFWNIENLGTKKGVYRLDARHLSGDRQLDFDARLEREYELRDQSYIQALKETGRLVTAKVMRSQAVNKMQAAFNFEDKPLQD